MWPSPDCLQVGQERLRAVDDTPEVDVHQPFEVLVGHRLDGGAERHAGVVDDQVDLAVVGDDLVGPGVDRVPVGHVEVLGGDLDSEALALRHRLGQAGLVDVAQRERALPGGRASLASARPMPEPAPVMAATRPPNSLMVQVPLVQERHGVEDLRPGPVDRRTP